MNKNTLTNKWVRYKNGFSPKPIDYLDVLPAGIYSPRWDDKLQAYYPEEYKMEFIDSFVSSCSSIYSELTKEINEFWDLYSEYINNGFTHKRSILLWGAPGTGKSAAALKLLNDFIKEKEGIVLKGSVRGMAALISNIRYMEPDRELMVFEDDMDSELRDLNFGESDLLNLLDLSINKIVYVLVSNEPENLHEKFTKRPSRIDIIRHIGMPKREEREFYIVSKFPNMDKELIAKIVEASSNMSIAKIKEICLAVTVYKKSLEDAVKNLEESVKWEKFRDKNPDTGKATKGIGIRLNKE